MCPSWNCEDFKKDKTSKIILAHNARELTKEEKAVGTSSLFGISDVLVPAKKDYDIDTIYKYLLSNFPTIDDDKRRVLLNFEIVSFNPKEMIVREGEKIENLLLVISGQIEKISKRSDKTILLKPGVIIGEKVCLNNHTIKSSFISKNFVKALKIPAAFFRIFVEKNDLKEMVEKKFVVGKDFLGTALFESGISYPTLNKLIGNMEKLTLKKGIFKTDKKRVYIVISGEVKRKINGIEIETIHKGESFGGIEAILNIPSISTFEITKNTVLYCLPKKVVKDIPIVRWKILEEYELLNKKILNIDTKEGRKNIFKWSSAYRIGINEMDNHHKKLFEILDEVDACLEGDDRSKLDSIIKSLLDYTKYHFKAEEDLLRKYHYPDLEEHILIHKKIVERLKIYKKQLADNTLDKEGFAQMTRNWLLKHILKEDTKYSSILNDKGVY